MDEAQAIDAVSELLGRVRWGTLATIGDDGFPVASQVAVAVEPSQCRLLLHLSELAEHTRNLLVRPQVSLALGEPDTGGKDPQTLARVTLVGVCAAIATGGEGRSGEHFTTAKACYLKALPAAEPRFEFGDFNLYAFAPTRAQYVGGFARAHGLSAQAVSAALQNVS